MDYVCDNCGGYFHDDKTVEESIAESQKHFPLDTLSKDGCILCDDCFHLFSIWMKRHHPTEWIEYPDVDPN